MISEFAADEDNINKLLKKEGEQLEGFKKAQFLL